MFGIGPMELVVILVMALLVLGPKRMPELARTLGRSLSELRRASSELRQSLALDELQSELRDGIAGAGKNTKSDRPAQAGDDLEPGKLGKAEGTTAASGAAGDTKTAPHPGELPLDEDPHAHHDDPPETTPAKEQPAAVSTSADSPLGNVPVGGDAPRPSASNSTASRTADASDTAGKTTGNTTDESTNEATGKAAEDDRG